MKLRLRSWFRLCLTLSLLTGCLSTTVQARLDETLAQCMERYGKSPTLLPGRAQDPKCPSYLFTSKITDANGATIPVRIRIEFNPEGRAWYIRYSGHYPAIAAQKFLELNAGDGAWGASEKFNDRLYYRTNSLTPYQAVHSTLSQFGILDIYTYEAVVDQKALHTAQTAALMADPNWHPFAAQTEAPAAASKIPPPAASVSLKFNGF